MKLTRNQWMHLLGWVVVILLVQIALLIIPQYAPFIFGVGTGAFIIGFILRALSLYPGKSEPPILDLSSGLLGLIATILFLPKEVINIPVNIPIRLSLFIPPVVLLPHIVYIITNKTVGRFWLSGFSKYIGEYK